MSFQQNAIGTSLYSADNNNGDMNGVSKERAVEVRGEYASSLLVLLIILLKESRCREIADMAEERETWANQVEVFLSVLGYIIGLGNIWRFPYMAFENGGGAFLIPYIISACVIGFPLFFLETALGQFMKKGSLDCWNIAPIMKGVGLGSVMICLFCNLYYITVMAWAVLYFMSTITGDGLPWASCDHWWNTDFCVNDTTRIDRSFQNETKQNCSDITNTNCTTGKTVSSSLDFWNEYVLRKSEGLESMGSLTNWPLFFSFLGSWIICYFCTFKGVKSAGKVVYFTATFPYVILLVLLVKGCTLPGALDGVKYYLEPNVTRLGDPKVWIDAASQIVYSYGICFATLPTFASYNNFKSDCFKHSVKLVICCTLTSILAGFAVFTVVGHLAYMQDVPIANLTLSGPGLVFLVFPAALSLMPLPNLWNALFFFLIIVLGIDSQFSGLEAFTTVLSDQFPRFFRTSKRRMASVAVICIIYFFVGLPFVMDGGVYVFQLFNHYAVSGIALLWLAMMESIGIAHIYGADRFCDDIRLMIGYKVPAVFKICIMFVTPLLCASILLFYIVKYSPPNIDGYLFPLWAQVVGWLLCMSSLLCVPFLAIYKVYQAKGSTFLKKLRNSTMPKYTSHIAKYRNEEKHDESEKSHCLKEKEELCPVELISNI